MESKRGRESFENNYQRAKSKTTIKNDIQRCKTISKLEKNRGRETFEGNRERAKSRAFSKTTIKKEMLRSKSIDVGFIRGKSKSSRKAFLNNLNQNVIRSSNKIISEIIKFIKPINLNFRLTCTKILNFNFQKSKFEKFSEFNLEFTNLFSLPIDKSLDFNNVVKEIKNIPLPKEITLKIKNDFRSYLKGEKVKSLGGLANIFSKKEEENLSLNFKADKPTFLMFMSIENIKRELSHIKNAQQIADEKQFKAINFVVLLKQGNITSKEYKKMLKKIGIKHDSDNIKFFKIANKKNTYSSNFLLLGAENFHEKLSYHNILISKEGKYVKTLDNEKDDIRNELGLSLLSKPEKPIISEAGGGGKKLRNIPSNKDFASNNLKKINLQELIDEDESNMLPINNQNNLTKAEINKIEIKKIKDFFKDNSEKIRKLNINLEKIKLSYFVCHEVNFDKVDKFYSSKPNIEIAIQKKYSKFIENLQQFLLKENLHEKINFQHDILDLKQEYLAITKLIEKSFISESLPYNNDNFSILKTNTTDIYEGYRYYCKHNFISKLNMKTIDFDLYKKYEKVEAQINAQIENNSYLRKINLKPKKIIGDFFDPIDCFKSITNKKSVISAKMNEVLVLEFWDSLDLDSIDSMNENQKIFKQNKNWKEQVRLIGLSVDHNLNDLKKSIKDNKLNLIEHYILDQENEKAKIYTNAYCASRVPLLLIINKYVKIAFIGGPFDIEIELVVNELINQNEEGQIIESLKDIEFEDYLSEDDELSDENDDEYSEENSEGDDNDYSGDEEDIQENEDEEIEQECNLLNIDHKLFKSTRNSISEHMYSLTSKDGFYNTATFIEEKIEYKLIENNIDENINKFSKVLKTYNFSTNLRFKDYTNLESLFVSKVYPIIPKESLKPNIFLIDTLWLIRGNNCYKCKNNIEKESQFYCYECNFFFCEPCANLVDSSKRGMERLIHNHNLIFIPSCVTELTEIDIKRIGKNKATLEKNIKRRDHDNACNYCERMIEGSRFVCMHCYPGVCDNFVDLCEKCLAILLDETHTEHKDTVKFCLVNDGHKMDSHVYLRLWFCNGSYSNY